MLLHTVVSIGQYNSNYSKGWHFLNYVIQINCNFNQLAIPVIIPFYIRVFLFSTDSPMALYFSSYIARLWSPTNIVLFPTRQPRGYLQQTVSKSCTPSWISHFSLAIICMTCKFVRLWKNSVYVSSERRFPFWRHNIPLWGESTGHRCIFS